jgi:hypothetical protein
LEGVNALAQLIAAMGVMASLFYLAAQIRQNTRSTRAVVVDSLAHSLVTLLAQHTQNRELLRAFSVVIENWQTASQDGVRVRFSELPRSDWTGQRSHVNRRNDSHQITLGSFGSAAKWCCRF